MTRSFQWCSWLIRGARFVGLAVRGRAALDHPWRCGAAARRAQSHADDGHAHRTMLGACDPPLERPEERALTHVPARQGLAERPPRAAHQNPNLTVVKYQRLDVTQSATSIDASVRPAVGSAQRGSEWSRTISTFATNAP